MAFANVAVTFLISILYLGEPSSESPAGFSLEPISVFPDFASIADVDLKKKQFFDYLESYIVAENQRILALREELQLYAAIVGSGVGLSPRERARVLELADKFRIRDTALTESEIVEILERRVDVVPLSLALAQAANESAWGTSRFTLEGNNIFGEWCYEEGCGIVPLRRPADDQHEVEQFDSVAESVSSYLTNINTHPGYQRLREIRQRMRLEGNGLDPMRLAEGLEPYSERGSRYIDEIQTLIRQNDLLARDRAIFH